jgi:hypothetical protein
MPKKAKVQRGMPQAQAGRKQSTWRCFTVWGSRKMTRDVRCKNAQAM